MTTESRSGPPEVRIPMGREGGARGGDFVLVRLDPSSSPERPRGRVIAVVDPEGGYEADLEAVRAEFDLPGDHPPAVEKAARIASRPRSGAACSDRLDLRDLLLFTVDPADARDFDDAVSLEPAGHGRVRLGVHIADVAHWVRPGSALDEEAARRGTSVYLPGHVIPMLPARLADDVCSLRPGEDRLGRTVFLTYDSRGRLERVEHDRSVLRNRRRFTYEEVQSILDRSAGREPPNSLPCDHAEYAEILCRMRDLASRLREGRRARGALAFDLPKLQIDVDERGEVTSVREERSDEAHGLIEEFMLAANEAVADFCVESGIPLVGRVHPAPDPERMEDLRALLGATGFRSVGGKAPADFQRLIAEVSGSPLAPVILVAMLRAMGHAEYVRGTGLHFALATERYCHFTSPIRRYPDLLVHQILGEHRDGKLGVRRRQLWISRLERLAVSASEKERRAEEAERAMARMRLIRHLEPMRGETFAGTIVSLHAFGFFVRTELLLEGLVHVATLGDDYYEFDRERMTLRGKSTRRAFRLGERVRVVLDDLDPWSRRVGYRLVDEGETRRDRSG